MFLEIRGGQDELSETQRIQLSEQYENKQQVTKKYLSLLFFS